MRILQQSDGITCGVFSATYLDACIDRCRALYAGRDMGGTEKQAIQNVIAAGLNRGPLETATQFYKTKATNTYARILHEHFISNPAYGFAYERPVQRRAGDDEHAAGDADADDRRDRVAGVLPFATLGGEGLVERRALARRPIDSSAG